MIESSSAYWERRYAEGGHSGSGSRGKEADFKADVINEVISGLGIASVVDLGCGDGEIAKRIAVQQYLGLDVSPSVIARCVREIGTSWRRFALYRPGRVPAAELALSIDVLFHLVEDEVFEQHLRDLFDAARIAALVYATHRGDRPRAHEPHVRHRRFMGWIETHAPEWKPETLKVLRRGRAPSKAFWLFRRLA